MNSKAKQKIIIYLSLIPLFFIFITTLNKRLANEEITVAGDPCSLPLVTDLLRVMNVEAETILVGCGRGPLMAAAGEVSIGVSTKNNLSSTLPNGAINVVIAKSPIVMVVNPKNPVNNISSSELQDIFSGKIRNWKLLGGEDTEIMNVMLAPCVKETLEKNGASYANDLKELIPAIKGNPMDQTNVLVGKEPAAIGQQIYGYHSKDVKVLKIDGVLPTPETLRSGAYKFYQEYNVVTKGKAKGKAMELIAFAVSREGSKVLRSLKHLPVE